MTLNDSGTHTTLFHTPANQQRTGPKHEAGRNNG